LKKIVLDSSTIICITENCLSYALEAFASKNKLEFVVPSEVYRESVEVPLKINRFKLNAFRVMHLIDTPFFEEVALDSDSAELAKEIEKTANSVFWLKKNPLNLVHSGEAETLALLHQTGSFGIGIDEKTTRLIVESPEKLHEILEYRNRASIEMDKDALMKLHKLVGKISFFRSVELISLAFKQGLLAREFSQNNGSLGALLYALKYSGCAVSESEIKDFLGE
jgi:hypothetical protein